MSALPFPPLAFPHRPQILPHPLGRPTSGLLLVPTPKVFILHETDPEDSSLHQPFFSLSSDSENLACIAMLTKIEWESDP